MTIKNTKLKHYYKSGVAKHWADAKSCYYCGCEATHTDYCPPLDSAELVLELNETTDFISVPCCYECFALIHNERTLLLQDRVAKLKQKLAKKYAKALKVFHMWRDDELDEMSPEFRQSIEAGMRLGEEASQRLAHVPFTLECDDAQLSQPVRQTRFYVNNIEFSSFQTALAYSVEEFQLNKSDFYDLLVQECNGDFDKALSQYHHRHSKPKTLDVAKNKILLFAKEHKQNSDFVARATESLMKRDAKLDIDGALAKLYRDYIER